MYYGKCACSSIGLHYRRQPYNSKLFDIYLTVPELRHYSVPTKNKYSYGMQYPIEIVPDQKTGYLKARVGGVHTAEGDVTSSSETTVEFMLWSESLPAKRRHVSLLGVRLFDGTLWKKTRDVSGSSIISQLSLLTSDNEQWEKVDVKDGLKFFNVANTSYGFGFEAILAVRDDPDPLEHSGLWKSLDGGETWEKVLLKITNPNICTALKEPTTPCLRSRVSDGQSFLSVAVLDDGRVVALTKERKELWTCGHWKDLVFGRPPVCKPVKFANDPTRTVSINIEHHYTNLLGGQADPYPEIIVKLPGKNAVMYDYLGDRSKNDQIVKTNVDTGESSSVINQVNLAHPRILPMVLDDNKIAIAKSMGNSKLGSYGFYWTVKWEDPNNQPWNFIDRDYLDGMKSLVGFTEFK